MLQLSDGQIVLSATDLTNHLACGHLTQQRLGMVRGERGRAQRSESPHADLLRERGDHHERDQLARLEAEWQVKAVDLKRPQPEGPDGRWRPPTREWLEEGAAATEAAMRAGHRLIFQASFFDGRWQGLTDFLLRVDLADATDEATRAAIERSTLGEYAYEVLDTKLSKKVKPSVVHQLELYSRLVGRIQGTGLPLARVILGNGKTEPVDLRNYAALHRRVVRRFEAVVEAETVETYPEPVAHCPICTLSGECDRRLRADDHLSLVARARRNQRELLVESGLPTVASLAGVAADVESGALATATGALLAAGPLKELGTERFELLQSQAALQVTSRASKQPTRKLLKPVRAAGLALLPDPSPGDLYFDLEGDPYVGEDGIEYLWGWTSAGADGAYGCVWAHDEAEEKAALEQFVDYVMAQRREHEDLHVFHYAPHERSKLQSLSVKYATREREVDLLLRAGVLVDLYAVVVRAMQVGEESYSLKKLERHHAFQRLETSVREGGGSIVAYEGYLETGDELLLESIRAYNEEDCRSTWSLREWLAGEVFSEATERWPETDWAELRRPEEEDDAFDDPEWVAAVQGLVDRLHKELPAVEPGGSSSEVDSPEQAEKRLLGDLLFYLRREQKPQYWRYFDLKDHTDPMDLIDERDALGGLALDPTVAPVSPGPRSRSLDYAFTFPAQDFKEPLSTIDPATGKGVNLVSFDLSTSTAVIRRAKSSAGEPFPVSIVPDEPIKSPDQRRALESLADVVLGGFGRSVSPPPKGKRQAEAASRIWHPEPQPHGRFAAVRALLRREPPRLSGGVELGESTEQLVDAVLALDHSVLPVQGPPGTGKTHNAARMIVAALQAEKRVGISAQSHAGIINLLRAVERHAAEVGYAFTGAYKGDPDAYESATGCVTVETSNDPIDDDLPQLVAGTAWFFARECHRRPAPSFDLIFIDEAGQFSLAQACAVGTSAHNLVLLGDPQQLPQVTQVEHPGGSGASVLEHVLGGAATIPEGRGVLLSETWRLHPEICDFVSSHSYDGKLRSHADCACRTIDAPSAAATQGGLVYGKGGAEARVSIPTPLTGAGLRTIEVEHSGNSQSSLEETEVIAEACRALLDGAMVTEPLRDAPAGSAPDAEGMVTRPLVAKDLLVVAPYNLAVLAIKRRVPKGVTVGTVDKIQGQEAAVVFYAMTCSTGEDVPRGLDFLFDRNRFNVAISRAQCLAVLVHAPELLDADCRTLTAMELVDGVCGLVEREACPEPKRGSIERSDGPGVGLVGGRL